MTIPVKVLVWYVIAFHAVVFAGEVFFWMAPGVHGFALKRLGGATDVDPYTQASLLRITFVNLGFYNLFLAAAGMAGLVLVSRGNAPAGRTLIAYMCLSAFGAGVILLFSTHAYVGAFLQAVPAATVLGMMIRAYSLVRRNHEPSTAG